ncbi:hypothetical protein F5876DRAFT_84768 [Lentinula aff. lateritia]|uniref:Uncharacterized protein n=1 Tax=Lentinula aff. lateritia TaxID=2804960 RepID=A0ACC1TGC4_9AGAR|nr:hypothetical protein F5876DRAFT_84768 [Lentinula aff. lateritia]
MTEGGQEKMPPHKMMMAHKYIPLWYFLPDAAVKVKEQSKESLDTNHLQFAVEDDSLSGSTVSLAGSHSACASPNTIPDSQLSWPQVMQAKSAFLNAIQLGTWPDSFIAMFFGSLLVVGITTTLTWLLLVVFSLLSISGD